MARGPNHVTKTIMADVGRDGHKTNAVSRAWRFDSKWLKVMATRRNAKLRSRALWKLIHYEHQLGGGNDPQLKEGKSEFEVWHGKLNFEQCRDKHTAAELAQEVDSRAEKEEAVASTRSIPNHRQWPKEGVENGLGRQHKMSRTANGWIPCQQGCDTADGGEDDEAWDDVSITQQAA